MSAIGTLLAAEFEDETKYVWFVPVCNNLSCLSIAPGLRGFQLLIFCRLGMDYHDYYFLPDLVSFFLFLLRLFYGILI